MHARPAVEPERRLVHDPTLHPLPGEGGQIRLGVRELGPGGHEGRSLPPRRYRRPDCEPVGFWPRVPDSGTQFQIVEQAPVGLVRRRRIVIEMQFGRFAFGSIEVEGTTYEHDLVIDGGRIRKRRKGPSKSLRSGYGHTPLSAAEDIPWSCHRLVVGSGAAGALPVMEDVAEEATRRGVELVILPTSQAIEELERAPDDTNAILHVTC